MDGMIRFEGVSKRYRLGVIGQTTLREDAIRLRARLLGREDPTLPIGRTRREGDFWALSDVSFGIGRGESVGIIGRNGAGKSTLLKLLSGISRPTEGRILLNGRVASMIEVGTGFHEDLTGRENIYLNGAILGMRRREIDRKLDEIVDYSECEEFIDTPVKRYSSGMRLKLGFSVAAHLDADIVAMDEILSVGDAAFREKCVRKMREIAASSRTVLSVSHYMDTIRSLCGRCIVLDHGKVVYDGDTESAIRRYMSETFSMELSRDLSALERPYWTAREARLERISVSGGNRLPGGGKLAFELRWTQDRPFGRIALRTGVWSIDGEPVAVSFADLPSCGGTSGAAAVVLDTGSLLPGKYSLELLLLETDGHSTCVKQDVLRDAIGFEILPDEDRVLYGARTRDWGHVELPLEAEEA